MKDLFLVDTVFQIITLVNMRLNVADFPKVDLLVSINGKEVDQYIKALEKSGLFGNIYRYTQSGMKLNRLFDKRNRVSFSCYFRKLKYRAYSKRKKSLLFSKGFSFEHYERVYFGSPHMMEHMKAYKDKLDFYYFDEGSLSYTRFIFDWGISYKAIYLYEPEVAEFYGQVETPIIALPKLTHKNKALLTLLNTIFGYEEESNPLSDGDILLLAQPLYFKNYSYILRSKVKRSESKNGFYHQWEEAIKAMVPLLQEVVKGHGHAYVKLHPLTPHFGATEAFYKKLGFLIYPSTMIPWEMMLLNKPDVKLSLLTHYSTAITSAFMYLESTKDNIHGYYFFPMLEEEFRPIIGDEMIKSQRRLWANLTNRYENIYALHSVEDIKTIS